MKSFFSIIFFLFIGSLCYAQQVYQIKADSVRIYNICDTAELILENRTQHIDGFLYNKGAGRTEFQKLKLQAVGTSQIAISGQDTLDLNTLSGVGTAAVKNIYTSDGILSGTRKLTGNQRSYGLTFDSLANFSAGGNLISLAAKNPTFSNAMISLVLQGGQSNWRAFSATTGTIVTDLEVGPGYFRATADGNELRINSSNFSSPGIFFNGEVHMSVITTPAPSYKIEVKDYFVAANSQFNNVTINLPNSSSGRILVIKKISAGNAVTVVCAGTNTIDGQASIVLMDNGAVLRLIGNGNGWYAY